MPEFMLDTDTVSWALRGQAWRPFRRCYGEPEISVEVETGAIHGHFPPRALRPERFRLNY